MKIYPGKNKKKGYFFVETIISLSIFSLVIITAVAAFSSIYSNRKNTREIQKNMENGRTALATMTKNMRMSSKLEFYVSGQNRGVRMFNNSQKNCLVYNYNRSVNTLTFKTYSPPGSLGDPGYPNCNNPGAVTDVILENVSVSFDIIESRFNNPKRIGRAVIGLVINSGNQIQNIQTTVSFRDYGWEEVRP